MTNLNQQNHTYKIKLSVQPIGSTSTFPILLFVKRYIVILLNYQVSIRHTGEGRYPGHANKC